MRERRAPLQAANQGDDNLYRIACNFPALRSKGVSEGKIPGITPRGIHPGQLAESLYRQEGQSWNESETLVVEFLLNLLHPSIYPFNFGRALSIWDNGQRSAFVGAVLSYCKAGRGKHVSRRKAR